jgi:hypothetical protein
VATPPPVFRSRAQTGADRVENDIGIGGNQITPVDDPPAPITATDELPNAVMARIEIPAVAHIQLLHAEWERCVGYGDDEVDVRAQLAEGNAVPTKMIEDSGESTDPSESVVIVGVVPLLPRCVHPHMA